MNLTPPGDTTRAMQSQPAHPQSPAIPLPAGQNQLYICPALAIPQKKRSLLLAKPQHPGVQVGSGRSPFLEDVWCTTKTSGPTHSRDVRAYRTQHREADGLSASRLLAGLGSREGWGPACRPAVPGA